MNVPTELKPLSQWVAWRYVERSGKWMKLPINCKTGGAAGPTWRNTWVNHRTAVSYAQQHADIAGVGFVLTVGDPYCCIDLDKCVGADGALSILAQTVLDRLPATWSEYSPSGKGLHVWLRNRQHLNCKHPGVEVYSSERFLTVTGQPLAGSPCSIAVADDLSWLIPAQQRPTTVPTAAQQQRETTPTVDDVLWHLIFKYDKTGRLYKLYNGDLSPAGGDHSKAIVIVLNTLARYTEGDHARMRRMIEQTRLPKDKWTAKRGSADWLYWRIMDACNYVAG